MPDNGNPLDPERYNSLIRSALDPDERKFFKEHLGQESPDIMDYLNPSGRFSRARDLREHINQQVLSAAIGLKPMEGSPTVGDALDINPKFPVPSSAKRTVDSMNVDRSLVPDTFDINQLQHTPFVDGNGPTAGGYTSPGEGQRSIGVTPYTEVDRNQLLPPVFQQVLKQDLHKRGLREIAPIQNAKANSYQRLQEIFDGDPERFGGEADYHGRVLGIVKDADTLKPPVGPKPLTDKERKLKAQADQEETKAKYTKDLIEATIKGKKATADKAEATTPLPGMKQAQLDLIISKSNLAKKQTEAITPVMDKHLKQLESLKLMTAMDLLDEDSAMKMAEEITAKNFPGLKAEGHDVSLFGGMFGKENRISVTKKAPTQQTTEQPTAQPTDKKAKAKALFDSLKDGDTGDLDGVKYKREGGKLVPVT